MNKNKILKDLAEVYDEIYGLERKRVEINKKIQLRKRHLFGLLNFLRLEKKQYEGKSI